MSANARTDGHSDGTYLHRHDVVSDLGCTRAMIGEDLEDWFDAQRVRGGRGEADCRVVFRLQTRKALRNQYCDLTQLAQGGERTR